MNKILTVAKHTFITNFATKWFLVTTLIPIFTEFFILRSNKIFNDFLLFTNHLNPRNVIALIIPVIAAYFCILYSSIIANEVVNDRTTRINELLFAMSSARIQLIGKIVGLYALLIMQLAMLTIATIFLAEWQRHFSLYIPSIFDAIYFIFNILFATFFGLIWTVQIAVGVDDNTQTALAIIPVTLIYLQVSGLAFSFALIPGKMSLGIARIVLDCVGIIPGIGSILMPVLYYAQNFSLIEVIISIIGEILIGKFLYKRAIKKYSVKALAHSNKKTNKWI